MNTVLLTNVTAFTPRCLPQATIWIENGKIRRVFSGPIPPQLQQIPQLDGKGAYALA